MSALADAGLTKSRRADGVMQATGPPSCAHVNHGPLNCRTTVRRLAFVNLSVYLPQKVRILFLLLHYFQTPGQEGVYWRPEHSRRDRNAGTNVTKLPGQTSYMNSHSRTPGQRVGRDTHAGTWIMDIVIAWPHTI